MYEDFNYCNNLLSFMGLIMSLCVQQLNKVFTIFALLFMGGHVGCNYRNEKQNQTHCLNEPIHCERMWNMLLNIMLLTWNVISSFLFSQLLATYPDVEHWILQPWNKKWHINIFFCIPTGSFICFLYLLISFFHL